MARVLVGVEERGPGDHREVPCDAQLWRVQEEVEPHCRYCVAGTCVVRIEHYKGVGKDEGDDCDLVIHGMQLDYN